jgi:hypothetical protein
MRQLRSLFQLICSFLAFAFEEYPITSLFVMGAIIYGLHVWSGTPWFVNYSDMGQYARWSF